MDGYSGREPPEPRLGEAMRIIRTAGIPVVIRIRRYGETTVVVPSSIPASDVLTAAGLILSETELNEFAASLRAPAVATGHELSGYSPQ